MKGSRAWPVVAVLALALGGSSAAAGQRPGTSLVEPPVLTTKYVAQLRTVAAQADTSLREVTALPALSPANRANVLGAGVRLAAAAMGARDVLRTYRDATERYGTAEEWRLTQKLLTDLETARTTYGQRGGVVLPAPTPQQRSTARQLFDAAVGTVAERQIARWTGDEGLAAALTSGSLSTVDVRLRQELERRLRTQAERAISDATGLSIALNVPLKQQVRTQVERLATNWLARAVLHVGPQSLVIQLAGAPIVNWIGGRLQAALRHSGNAVGRAQRTMAQLAAWRSQLLLLSPTSSLSVARALATKIDHELDRSGFLKLDLRRAHRPDVLADLERSESLTRTSLQIFRARFLLDSTMARADMNALVDRAKRVLHDVEEISRRIAAKPTEDAIVGDWQVGKTVMRVTRTGTTTFVGRLVQTYTFCRSGSVPLGQAEWMLTRTAENKYTGSIRYYRVSDCTYIGDAKNGTWEYRADDTLRACSSSPNPSYPGGGCDVWERVKT